MICGRCKQKTFVIYIVRPDHEKVCDRECKGKNNKYPVLFDDFKSRKEVVCQLFVKRQFKRYQMAAYQVVAHGRNWPHGTLISKKASPANYGG
jgi:hypothetical protein